jgi:hypothetical protein
MSVKELEAIKEYIIENLNKRFIMPSNIPFTSPILIAKKQDSGLHFYIDY